MAAAEAALAVADQRGDFAGAKMGLGWLREAVASVGMVGPTTKQEFRTMIDEAESLVRRISPGYYALTSEPLKTRAIRSFRWH